MGNQRFSYNQELSFKLRVNDDSAMESQDDIIIEAGGDKPTRIALSVTSQNNSLPSLEASKYIFYLSVSQQVLDGKISKPREIRILKFFCQKKKKNSSN